MKKILEVCVDSYASAEAAVKGGADRLELCSCLQAGGISPDAVLLEQIKKQSRIPVRCLMRPRPGDFLYSDYEISLMEEQIKRLIDSGADGFVIGCLDEDGNLDCRKMEKLIKAAGNKKITLHRAIDMSRDGIETAGKAAELGVDTVLTSGQAENCWEGRGFIGRLLDEKLPLTVMAGAGVNAEIIGKMLDILPLEAFHMSGKKTVQSGMRYRRQGVSMGLPGMDEYSLYLTDENSVREAAYMLRKSENAE